MKKSIVLGLLATTLVPFLPGEAGAQLLRRIFGRKNQEPQQVQQNVFVGGAGAVPASQVYGVQQAPVLRQKVIKQQAVPVVRQQVVYEQPVVQEQVVVRQLAPVVQKTVVYEQQVQQVQQQVLQQVPQYSQGCVPESQASFVPQRVLRQRSKGY